MNQTAQGLAALGRGPDTMLVHMAPEEVAGLQALALKHGGTLTINPETGLAEAGFLKKILPMVAGFALNTFAPGLGTAVGGMFGLGSAAGTALTVGGISALSSGSLEKGLMAGLGAYGGAGLSQGLIGAGTGALSSAAPVDAVASVPQAPVFEAAAPAAAPAATSSGVSADMLKAGAAEGLRGGPDLLTSGLQMPPATFAAQSVPTFTQAPAPVLSPSAADLVNANAAKDLAEQNAVAKALANKTPLDRLGAGFNAVTSSSDAALKFAKNNMMPLGALGIAALSSDDKKVVKPNDPGMIRPYTYTRTKVPGAFDRTENDPMSSRERQYFNDQYTALTPYKAPGPEYMAEGGPVEEMSDANAIGMNTGYPQSDIRTGAYATPYQQPISRNVVSGAQDAAVNPYTGQAQFADGGSVGGYLFDPRTGLYSKPGGEGATTVSPLGGVSGASGSSGGPDVPLDPRTAAFLDNETPQERDARMMSVDRAIGKALGFMPGPLGVIAGLSDLARSGQLSTLAGGIANFFGGTQAPAPVSNAISNQNYGFPGNDSMDLGGGNPTGDRDFGGGSTDAAGRDSDGTPLARGGLTALAQGGMSNLGDYSDGGRLLRGPGDGVSDDIPAMIGQKQQARLADGEFVVPARIVSELGNGSTEAGARQLYAMMDRVQKARKKTVGKDKVATNSRAARLLPA